MQKPREGFYSVVRKQTGKTEAVEVRGFKYQFEGNWYHLSSVEVIRELRPAKEKNKK